MGPNADMGAARDTAGRMGVSALRRRPPIPRASADGCVVDRRLLDRGGARRPDTGRVAARPGGRPLRRRDGRSHPDTGQETGTDTREDSGGRTGRGQGGRRDGGVMKVLVTGASGFLGGHLVDHCVRAGHHVRALVRGPNKGVGRVCR
ncbi:NmrA family NAD(P)-binding protein [Streptomyces sp. NPDC059680]|uniref:NmrA family NAD(P)-binding protein n=1 Tax=Streptomyces sp. NPDC059680 TaxID=3346904 RepID=UPI0036A2FE1A